MTELEKLVRNYIKAYKGDVLVSEFVKFYEGMRAEAMRNAVHLRDNFAAHAMQEIMALEGYNLLERAKLSYEMADAMLEARESTKQE